MNSGFSSLLQVFLIILELNFFLAKCKHNFDSIQSLFSISSTLAISLHVFRESFRKGYSNDDSHYKHDWEVSHQQQTEEPPLEESKE